MAPPPLVAPTTVAPTTVAPTTVAPTTVAPTTVAPTTVAPTTIAPTTIAPTTVAPTTVAPTTVPTSQSCTNPSFVTSAPFGGESNGNYYLYNNEWNASGYQVTQTMYVCSYNNWYVVANMNNNNGDGAVKTYPDVQANFNEPAISSFKSITSSFSETSPHVGIYEDAYDIWINGVASSGSTELMIWNDNYHQVPGGSVVGSVTFDGRAYTVWKSGSYIALVANTTFTAGTVNLLAIFDWVISQGWIPSTSTLGQICYGAELVSTNSTNQTFTFNNFSVSTS